MFTMTKSTAALVGALALTFAACSDDPPVVQPPSEKPKPTITTFRANPTTVARGATTTLEYAVTNATGVTFSTDAGSFATPAALMGTVTTPVINTDTVFTLTATGEGGTTTQRVTVTIDANAVAIVSFAASPMVPPVNSTVTLNWQTAGATSIRVLADGAEILANSGDRVASGMIDFDVADRPVLFRLEASNAAGMNASREITVTPSAPVEIRGFSASPTVFTGASAMVDVTWDTRNATGLTLTANGVAVPGFMGNVATGTVTVNVTDATTFELTAQGAGGPLTRRANVSRGVGEVEPNNDQASAMPLNGSGAQGSITAADVDFYSVTVAAGGNLTVDIGDGMGGCPFDTLIVIYDAMGMEITRNDDRGKGELCSLLDPRQDRTLVDMAAGTYYIEVRGFDEMETGDYSLVVQVGTAGCGNGFFETSTMEQCEDGNTMAGDGCSATCRFEIAGSITDNGDMTFTGMIAENGVAAYTVTLTNASYLAVDTFTPTAGVCSGSSDLYVVVLDSTGTAIGEDDDDGLGLCAAIIPSQDDFAFLQPGTYTVLIFTLDGSALPAFAARIRAVAPGCGNTVQEMGEECDDGNTAGGDGCNNMCVIELAGTVMGGTADQTFSGAIIPGGALTIAVNITAPAFFYAETGVPTIGACGTTDSDTLLVLTSSTGREVLRNDTFEGRPCARIDVGDASMPAPIPVGNYRLTVSAPSAMGRVPALQVRVRLTPMGCGDGAVNGNEQCDDGNATADGNGCSAACQFDMSILVESEPNNTAMTADALPATVRTATAAVTGGISPAADVDVYAFDVAGAPAALTARTYGRIGRPESGCRGSDTILTLTNAAGMTVARNDDIGGGNTCSEISMTTTGTAAGTLAPGRYYLTVSEFLDDGEVPRYFLDVRLR